MVTSWIAAATLLLQDGAAPPGNVRALDVSEFLRSESSNVRFDLAPGPNGGATHDAPDATKNERVGRFDGSDLKELLTRMLRVADAKGDGDVRIEVDESKLLVDAPEAGQREVDRALAWLRDAMIGDARLEMRAFACSEFDVPALAPRLTIDAKQADRLEDELVRSGRGRLARNGSAALVDGRVGFLDVVTTQPIVDGFDLEIGGMPVHYQPRRHDDVDGLSASFRSSRVEGGTYLDLALRYAESATPMRTLAFEPNVWFAEPKEGGGAQMFHGKVPLKLDLPLHRFASCAGSFVIPDGQAMWLPCRFATTSGSSAYLVDLRVVGSARRLVQRWKGKGGREVALVHVGHLGSPGFTFGPFDQRRGLDAEGRSLRFRDERSSDEVDSRWPSQVEANETGSRVFDIPGSFESVVGAPDGTEASLLWNEVVAIDAPTEIDAALIARYVEFAQPPPSFEFHARVTSGERVVAEFRLPLLAGRAAGAWFGGEHATLGSWGVDVADQTYVGQPFVGWSLDGLALAIVAMPCGPDRVRVEVDGVVRLEDGPPQVEELGNPCTPIFETLRSHRLAIDTSAIVATGAATPPLRIGGTKLALEWTVAAR